MKPTFQDFVRVLAVLGLLATLLSLGNQAIQTEAAPVNAAACTRYVALSGSDSNSGSSSSPWRTIQRAADQANPGDVICVQPGTYEQQVEVTRSGASGQPIVFQANGAVVNHGFIIEADYIHVIGFEMTVNGVSVEGGSYCAILDNDIHDLDYVGIDLLTDPKYSDSTMTSNCVVRGNTITYAVKNGIGVMGRGHLIEDNEISHTLSCSPYSSYCSDADGIRFFGSEHVFRGNFIHDIMLEPENLTDPHIDCFQTYHTAHHILFDGNTCYNYNTAGTNQMLMLEEKDEGDVVSDLTFINNLFVMAEVGNSSMNFNQKREGETIENMTILNNTFIHLNLEGLGGKAIGFTRVVNAEVRNNIFYNFTDSSHTYVKTEDSQNINISNNLIFNANGVKPKGSPYPGDVWLIDPRFVDVAGFDFRLRSDSPAIDAGMAVDVDFDHDGLPRPQGGGWDIGAFEYSTGAPTPTFADVPFSHPYHDAIETLYQAGYTAGCGENPLRYCPDDPLTRAESAVFTVRGQHGADVSPTEPYEAVFADVFLTDWHADWVNLLWLDGFTAGCGVDPLVFCPGQVNNRAEGAVFGLRMKYGRDYLPPAAQGLFADLTAGWWGTDWSEAAYQQGLIPACSQDGALPLQFCPNDPMLRGLAAGMIVAAKELQ